MEQNYDVRTSSTIPHSAVSDTRPAPPGNEALRLALGAVLTFAMAVAAYSVYIAVHEPDPQETVVLGQTKFAAASPAALRILVRNRVSGKPVQGAEVELSLRSPARTVKLGAFRTDMAGSIADSINLPEMLSGP